MMIDALRHLVLIAQHGTFTKAARHAHLSQPALSASIQRLEQAFGARLLDRGRGGAALTAAGDALLPRARAALAAIEDGRRAVGEVAGVRAGEVRVGAGATACTYLLPPVLAAFRSAHPGVRILLREAPTADVLAALEAGDLDLGVVARAPGERPPAPPLRQDRWLDDDLVLVGAPGAGAASAPFVTLARGTTTRELLERYFPGADVAIELGGIAAVKGSVRAGIGVALVSRAAVASDLALGRLVLLPHRTTPIRRVMLLAHRGADRLPPAAAELRRLLLERTSDPRSPSLEPSRSGTGERRAVKPGRAPAAPPRARRRRARTP